MGLITPVVFIIFNRPETTWEVFKKIQEIQPEKLLVISDGPRLNHPDDDKKCQQSRKILEKIDWKCEVLKNYSDCNLGCAKRISSGLNWVFDNVDEAIILEDDCVPSLSFFPFCETLLERFKHDERLFSIAGQNVQPKSNHHDYSYYFSRYHHCWGWATWKRSWAHFDFSEDLFQKALATRLLEDIVPSHKGVDKWRKLLQATYDGKLDSWAFRWTLSCWMQSGISAVSNVNLVSNIGFGNSSTNTQNSEDRNANLEAQEIEFPLTHPEHIVRNFIADSYTQKSIYDFKDSFIERLIYKLQKAINP